MCSETDLHVVLHLRRTMLQFVHVPVNSYTHCLVVAVEYYIILIKIVVVLR